MKKNTKEEPKYCFKCGCKNVGLHNRVFKKDKNGKETDIPYLGIWLCNECGEILGRMIAEGCNELYYD